MKMKRFLASLMSICMAISSMSTIAFAEGEETVTPAYAQGDLVWSEDFEGYENGADFSANPSHDIALKNMDKTTVSANINEIDGNNKYLKLVADSTTTNNQTAIFVPAGNAKDDNGVFTVDVDLKIPYNAATVKEGTANKAAEYEIGFTSQTDALALGSGARAYFTLQGNAKRTEKAWNFNGTRVPATQNVDNVDNPRNTDLNKGGKPYSFTAWNTYRYIVRKYNDGTDNYWYADVYVNGNYFHKIGVREGQNIGLNGFYINLVTRKGLYQEVSIDNIKMYYGATAVSAPDANGNSLLTKGVFNSETIDFEHLTPGVISENKTLNGTAGIYVGDALQESGNPIVHGANTSDYSTLTYEARSMIARRHAAWTTTYSAVAGKGGKAKDDVSLVTAGQGGRLKLVSAVTDDSVRPVTYLHEGDSFELSADVMFTSGTQQFTFNPEHFQGGNNGVTVSPYWYAAAHFQDPNEYTTFATNFTNPIPLNKWVNIKIVLTRGTTGTYNKLSIYCDNAPMVVGEDIDSWYANNSYTNKVRNEDAQPIKGDLFAMGFKQISLDSMNDYDNIKINRYLQTEYVAPAVPTIITKTRGVVYPGAKTAAEVIAQYGIASDNAVKSYVVRDDAGNEIDASTPAAGNYIAITTFDGEELYVKMIADETPLFEINSYEDYEAKLNELGMATSGTLTFSGVDGAYGKDVSDTGIKIEVEEDDKNHFFNIVKATDAKNLVFEFSVLPNETSTLRMGYRLKTNSTNGYEEATSAVRFEKGAISGYGGEIGQYKSNEWQKVKIYFDRDARQILASFNGGEPLVIKKNLTYYSLDWIRFSLTETGSSAIIDDIKLYHGADPVYTAPSMTIDDEISSKYFDNTISLPAYEFGTKEYILEELFTTSFTPKYIDVNGAEVADDKTVVDKLVIENDGIYTYYDVVVRDGITLVDNETEGKITAIVDGVSEEDIYSNVKLIRAVYNADKTFVSAAIYNVPFELDENGAVINWSVEAVADEYTPAEGETVKYFAWGMEDNAMIPVCDALYIQ